MEQLTRQAIRSGKPRRNPETDLQDAIRDALAWDRDVRLFRSNTGLLPVGEPDATGRRRFVRFGLQKGGSDLIGLMKPHGRFLALEVKRPGEEPTKKQRDFLADVRAFGGFGCAVQSIDQALAAVARAKAGAFE